MPKNPLLTLFFLIASLIALNTRAQAAETAEDFYKEGMQFLEKGQYIRALARFEQAWELNRDWKYLEPTGKALAAQNRNLEAIDKYRQYLSLGGKKIPQKKRTSIEEEISRLKKVQNWEAHKEEAQSHYQKGTELHRAGEYERAIIEFERAYELSGEYFIKRNIAVLELALGNGESAVKEFRKYLRYGEDKISPKDRQAVEDQIAQIESQKDVREREKEAAEDIEDARRLMRNDNYQAAYDKLEESYKQYRYFETLRYIGIAAAGLKHFRRALYFNHGYLAAGGSRIDNRTRIAVEKEMETLRPMADREDAQARAIEIANEAARLHQAGQYHPALSAYEDAYRQGRNWKLLLPIAEICEHLTYQSKALRAYEAYVSEGASSISTDEREIIRARIRKLEKDLRSGDTKAKSAAFFAEGKAAHKDKRFTESAAKFEMAYNLNPTYEILYWYGEAEAKQQHYEKAIALFQLFLEEGRGSINRKQRQAAENNIADLKNHLRSKETPEDMDKALATMLDVPIEREPVIAQGRTQPMTNQAGPEPQKPRNKRVWSWVTLGLGVGMMGGGVACAMVAQNEQEKIDLLCPDEICQENALDGAMEREQTVHTLETLRTVGIISGGVLLTTSIVLFIVEPKWHRSSGVSVAPSVSDRYAGVFVNGTF